MRKFVLILVGCVVSGVLAAEAEAQVVWGPAVPVTTFYAPAGPVVHTSFFAPAPVVAYRPVTVARTRYRPFLGGTVTRYRPAYAPVVVQPAPVVWGF
jgi:hypothetical protein